MGRVKRIIRGDLHKKLVGESVSTPVTVRVFEVPEDVSAKLRELSAAGKVSFGAVLGAACAALLHRYSCEGALTVRTTNAGRSESQVQLVPMSLVIPGNPSFEQMLERARQILPDRPELQGSDEWTEWNEIEILMSPEIHNELIRSQLRNPQEHQRDGLKVGFRKTSRSLTGTLTHRVGAFEENRAMRMAEHLQAVLREVAETPTAHISELTVLGDQERRQILSEWNDTDCGYADGCVPDLVEKQAERTPHAVALIQGGQTLTYGQLNQQANRLANYLRARGVGPEVFVGLCIEQSLQAVVAVLGILKAGGAYVPLDPSFPQQRLEEMAADAKLAIAVTSARFDHRVPVGIETVCVDRDAALIAATSPAAPVTTNTPDSAAYVLYTSASTGKPKGVVGIHRSITNGLNSVTYVAKEICCLNAFLSFGFSVANLFLPLMRGVPLVIASDEQIRDINQLMNVLEQEGVTRIALVPSLLKQILDPDFGAAARLKKIRTIGVAGAELTPSVLKRLSEAMPQAKLHNVYSSTEIGTLATQWNVTDESLANGEIAIGRPVANTRIYLLDQYRNPVPVGVVGEIYVGAAHLSRGYLSRPDLTEERFIPDPFDAKPGRRLFRTGDLGRFRSNGEIELFGRADDQVKINGFRIDLPEVERALASHVGVSEAATAVREIGHWQRLVAYVVAKPIGTPSASQLRNYLQERLPDYMIPSMFVFLNALPVVSNGKVDRKALPLPEPVRPKLETGYEPPGSPMEAAIALIWSDLLGLHPIGVHDNFLDLGGDSLFAAQAAVRICEQFGAEITPEALFERPTIAEVAVYLAGSCPASANATLLASATAARR
jgi:amino acid adenylation domain-containing protein